MANIDNPHIGSSFESFLDEHGIREEVMAAAIKEVSAASRGSNWCENAWAFLKRVPKPER